MSDRIELDNIAIVLNGPRIPENIGMAARAMKNMGFKRLLVVNPKDRDLERMRKTATHEAADIVEHIEYFDTLAQALSNFQYTVGTTARLGKQRQVITTPARLAQILFPLAKENDIAIVFGAEDRGLLNEDLQLCQVVINIPTAGFSSLNLAQAVMIVCYELFVATCAPSKEFLPKLAKRHELEGMYATLKDILVKVDFINPENPDYWMNNLRRFFNRLPLRKKEVNIIRGICRQIYWYSNKRYQDGIQDGMQEGIKDKTSKNR